MFKKIFKRKKDKDSEAPYFNKMKRRESGIFKARPRSRSNVAKKSIQAYREKRSRRRSNSLFGRKKAVAVKKSSLNNNFTVPEEKKISVLEIDPKDIQFEALWNNMQCAFKCFTVNGEDDLAQFRREAGVCARVKHKNILKFFGVSLQQPRIGIVMEYCHHGSLRNFLEKHPNLPWNIRLVLLHEIGEALDYLHSLKILHRDIKLENVLIDNTGSAKLIDFGLSRMCSPSFSGAKTIGIGTGEYIAPELFMVQENDGRYDTSCDVFSYAMLCYILISGNFYPYGRRMVVGKMLSRASLRPSLDVVLEKVKVGGKIICEMIAKGWHEVPGNRPKVQWMITTLGTVLKLYAIEKAKVNSAPHSPEVRTRVEE